MSKHETPMTLAYWESVGGTLVEEFRMVSATKTCGGRLIDAIILPDGERRRVPPEERSSIRVEGRHIIAVQTKAQRLGMYLMGQAFFSARILEGLGAASVRTVALCTRDDSVLGPLARAHGIEVVVIDRE